MQNQAQGSIDMCKLRPLPVLDRANPRDQLLRESVGAHAVHSDRISDSDYLLFWTENRGDCLECHGLQEESL